MRPIDRKRSDSASPHLHAPHGVAKPHHHGKHPERSAKVRRAAQSAKESTGSSLDQPRSLTRSATLMNAAPSRGVARSLTETAQRIAGSPAVKDVLIKGVNRLVKYGQAYAKARLLPHVPPDDTQQKEQREKEMQQELLLTGQELTEQISTIKHQIGTLTGKQVSEKFKLEAILNALQDEQHKVEEEIAQSERNIEYFHSLSFRQIGSQVATNLLTVAGLVMPPGYSIAASLVLTAAAFASQASLTVALDSASGIAPEEHSNMSLRALGNIASSSGTYACWEWFGATPVGALLSFFRH